MARVITGNTNLCDTELTVYYTPTGKELLLDNSPKELKIKYFGFSDNDINYLTSLKPSKGEVPDLSGNVDECLPKIRNCIDVRPTIAFSDEKCYTLEELYSIAVDNNVDLNVLIKSPFILSATANFDRNNKLLIKPNTITYSEFSSKFGYNTMQEMLYDITIGLQENKYFPFICGNDISLCCIEDECYGLINKTSQCGIESRNSASISDRWVGYELPVGAKGYVIIDWYFYNNNRILGIRDNINPQFQINNVNKGGSYLYYYDGTNIIFNDVLVIVSSTTNPSNNLGGSGRDVNVPSGGLQIGNINNVGNNGTVRGNTNTPSQQPTIPPPNGRITIQAEVTNVNPPVVVIPPVFTPSTPINNDWAYTIHCPTEAIYECGDTIFVSKNRYSSSRSFIFSGGTTQKNIRINYNISGNKKFVITATRLNQKVAESNSGNFTLNDGFITFNYNPSNINNLFVVTIRKENFEYIDNNEISFEVLCV